MTMQGSQAPATGPLPILGIAAESFQLLLRNPVAFVAALIVPCVIELLATWGFWTTYGPEMIQLAATGGGQLAEPGLFFLRSFGLVLVLLIAYSLFAVAWHRFALVEQKPSLLPAVQGRHLRFLLATWGLSFLIGLIAMGCVLLLGAFRIQSQIAFVLVGLGLVLIFARWQLVFPAIAVDRPLGLSGAWRATRGHTLRLFWLLLLVVVPPEAVSWAVGKLFEDQVGVFMLTGALSPGAIAGLVINSILSYVMLALLVGALSGAYRVLVLGQTPTRT